MGLPLLGWRVARGVDATDSRHLAGPRVGVVSQEVAAFDDVLGDMTSFPVEDRTNDG